MDVFFIVDHFARLNLPRRPWLDGEQLRQRFHDLSADAHPDQSHNADAAIKAEKQDDFTEINEAYQCLDDAKCRVRHLIELERARHLTTSSRSAEMTDWFMEIGDTCRKVDVPCQKGKAGFPDDAGDVDGGGTGVER